MSATVLLIGCGNMGFAMLSGWLGADPGLNAYVVEPVAPLRERAAGLGAVVAEGLDDLPDMAPDLIVLAVKPAMIAPVLQGCGHFVDRGACIVSVAAGTTMATMLGALPDGAHVIRCMPNTPASIGEGMMVLCAGPGVEPGALKLSEQLFAASGSVAWVEDEALMDAVTAISGSGPAYVFHFVEALTEAAIALGLPAETASLLAKQTVSGAGQMVFQADDPPATLRENVTSPGGTTAAALAVLMGPDGLSSLVKEAATAARDRGVELGREN